MPAESRSVSKVRYLNPLNEARYHVTLQQLRIIMAAISHLDSTGEVSDQNLYTVSASDLKDLGVDRDGVYSIMRAEVKKLRAMSATIPLNRVYRFPELRAYFPELFEKYSDESEIEPNATFEFSFVQSAVYRPKMGQVEIRFNHDFIPFIQKLKEHYTEIGIMELRGLNSVYAMRIYQYVAQYQYMKDRIREVSLEELRSILGLEDKYPKFGMFNMRVLQPSLKSINESEYTRYHIDMDVIKGGERGTRVERLVFKLTDKPFRTTGAIGAAPAADAAPIDEYGAFMTPRQKSMYADWLSGSNTKKTAAYGFNPQNFFRWLQQQGYKAPGTSYADLAEWLKVQLGNSKFIQEIYDPWLKSLGFKPKKAAGK